MDKIKKYKSGIIGLIICTVIMSMLIGVMIETDREISERIKPDAVYPMINQKISWD